MALNVGDHLWHYDVTALIGEGGMGEVYGATETSLGRTVTVTEIGSRQRVLHCER